MKRAAWFAVYDGHGGEEASSYLEWALHGKVDKALQGAPCAAGGAVAAGGVVAALEAAFAEADAELCATPAGEAGSTAACCLCLDGPTGWLLFAANVGDSRVVLCRRGGAVALTRDQKPTDPEEKKRITAAGGFVMRGRVLGDLAVSRAFGDFKFKDADDLE